MERGTITIDVSDYNELRDFKKAIEAKKAWVIGRHGGGGQFMSNDEAIDVLTRLNKGMQEENEKLRLQEFNGVTIDYIKMMSWREFKRWRKRWW